MGNQDHSPRKILQGFLDSGWANKTTEQEVESDQASHSTDIISEAKSLIQQGVYDDATKLLESLLDLFPDQTDANELLEEAKKLRDIDIDKEVGDENDIPHLEIPLTSPRLMEMKITGQEGFLLSRIDGKTSIRNLCQLLQIKRVEIYPVLYRLKKAEVISIKPGTTPKKRYKPEPPRSRPIINF